MPPELVGLRPRHDAEGDVAGLQQFDPRLAGDDLAARRQDRRDINQILLLDVRVAQGELESGQGVAMNADALG